MYCDLLKISLESHVNPDPLNQYFKEPFGSILIPTETQKIIKK